MKMIAVKVCGICNLADAEKAVELGSDYIGLIFAESKRSVDKADARSIKRKLSGKAKFVGVFRNQDLQLVNDTASALNLDYVQLHGNESPDYCRQMDAAVIKAVELPCSLSGQELGYLSEYSVRAFLFDRKKTDVSENNNDWLAFLRENYLERLKKFQPFFIAGGISSMNIREAVELQPYGLDLASSLEKEAGVKDHDKMEAFFRALKETCI